MIQRIAFNNKNMITNIKIFKTKAVKNSIGPTAAFHVDHVYIGEPRNVRERS